MAAETPVIEIRTLEAVKNVKELKENISALKAKIDDVNTSTDEYADLTRELSQNQAALRNVMNGTNSAFDVSIKDAQGLTTSYNSLVQQLKAATQEWRTIPKYLTDADQAQGKVNQAWTDAAQKVNALRTELKSMDADTNSYVRNVGNYKSALDGFSGAMRQVKQVGGDMVNGISAAASSMAMLGINTDGLSTSMNNLRIAVAAVQGAKGFAGLLSQLRSYFKAGKQAATVTKQQATATQAQAAAQTAANTATAAGTVALNGLQKALIATGIGALVVGLGMLVAHFEDIVKWVGKIGEKFGLWKMQTDQIAGSTDKLKTKIEQQNHALENEQKIRSAQGASNVTLLKQKKELVQQQINDTKATIENVKARIAQLQADDRWWKFWQGTKGKVKKATEELEGLEEVLKNLNQIQTDIDVDIQVEGIKGANEAAANAKKAAEDAYNLAKSIVDKGISEANNQLRAQETELEKIKREYKEQVDAINSALEKAKEITGVTKEQIDLLNNGLTAAQKNYNNAISEYYKKEYERKAAEQVEKVNKDYDEQYASLEMIDAVVNDILATEGKQPGEVSKSVIQQQKAFDILNAQLELIKKDIPFAIEDMPELKFKTDKELVDEFLEPTATAIREYFNKSDELTKAGQDMLKTMVDGYTEAIRNAEDNGFYDSAEILAYELSQNLREALNINMQNAKDVFSPIGKAYNNYILNLYKEISEARENGPLPTKGLFADLFGGFDKNDMELLRNYHWEMDQLAAKGEETSSRFITASELATKLSMKMWDDYFKKLGKHFSSYGKATTNVMDAVAECWEAALQAQVKNGKKSEKEAKKSFENVKKLQMASAIINTGAAIVQALADPTVPSYYVKAANAVAAGIAGAAQVIKISSTEFSASASQSTESTPKLVDRTPQLQYTVGLNPQDYAEAQAQNPIRAYVVDRDLSDGLDEYNRRRNETTF